MSVMPPFSDQSTPTEIAHFNEHAHEWWDQEGALKTLHEINPVRLAWIEEFTDLKNKKILDLGCGGGILTEALAKKQADVLGIDLAADVIDVARLHALEHARLYPEQTLRLQYLCQSSQELLTSQTSVKFDVIACMEMLEHVDDPQAILHDCSKMLTSGGYLFLSTINRTYEAYVKAILLAEYVLKLVPKHTHFYDQFIQPAELANYAKQAGFKIIAIQGLDYQPFRSKKRRVQLSQNVNINYMMCCQKI